MPECTYCGESFADEEAYRAHLGDAHDDELSPIDRRRVDGAGASGDRSRVLLYAAVGVVVLLLAAAVYVTTLSGGGGDGSTPLEAQPLPDAGDDALLSGVQHFPSEGAAHVSSDTRVDYDTEPPTSGPHYNDWADPGFYEEPVPAGNLVHSLEHGNVVVYYDPAALTPEAEASLRAFARAHTDQWAAVVVVPNPTDDPASPYVLTAWRTTLRMDGYDAETVRAFLADYLGRGPENPVR